MQSINTLLYHFEKHLKVLNRSPATIKLFKKELKLFFRIINISDIRQVTTETIENYISGLYDYRSRENKPYAINTLKIKIQSIKRFFEFLENSNFIFINPAQTVYEPRRVRNRVKDILTHKEVKLILAQPDLNSVLGFRNRTILEVLYSTGIRSGEIRTLKVSNINFNDGLIMIRHGKGGKDRVVPIGSEALRFLKRYISKIRPCLTKKRSSFLFLKYSGTILTRAMVRVMVKKYAREAGINKQINVHTFRHTFASELVKNYADIRAVQLMLGHASLKATQVYVSSLGLDVKAEHKRTHPREKDDIDLFETSNIKRMTSI